MINIIKSLLVHSFLIVFLFIENKDSKLNNKSNVVKVNIEGNSHKNNDKKESLKTVFISKSIHGDKKCELSYEGIGISIRPYDDMVIELSEGGPAGKAGIKLGDFILSPSGDKIRGPKGSKLIVIFKNKYGKIITKTVVRDKICYQTPKS